MNTEAVINTANKGKKWFAVVLAVVTVMGSVGFMMFVFEEAMQTAMFGAFAYNNAKDYYGLQQHIKVMETIHASAETWIRCIGWLNPLMYPAYLKYLEANREYINSNKALVRKNLG